MTTDIQVSDNMQAALSWPEIARSLAITSNDTYQEAAGYKKTLRELRQKIEEEFKPMKDAAFKAHKAITSKEAEYLLPLTTAEALITSALKRWQDEQEGLRLAEQRRLMEEHRLQELAARLERIKQAEVLRAQEQERMLAEAVAAEAMGIPVVVEEAPPVEAFIEPVAYTPPPVAMPSYEKVKGLAITRTWSAKVTNLRLLAKAVADGTVPESYILPNTVALNGRARSDKSEMRIPGVEAQQQ